MKNADVALVYFSPKTLEHKNLAPITSLNVKEAFACKNLTVYINPDELASRISLEKQKNTNFLLMSSGNFSGIDLEQIID
jgi:UDP-N-acetylmuramate: L-alanyl-gamma-D-glutamyl-meso-diaminopimelate ligase